MQSFIKIPSNGIGPKANKIPWPLKQLIHLRLFQPRSMRLVFITTRTSNTSTLDLFTKIKAKSNGKFSYEFVDPETNPAKAQQYKITQDGSVVLVMQGRQEVLTSPTEQDFTNALVRLMNPGQRAVYFLTGHGERDIQNSSDKAYTRARTVLESKNYTVKSLNLLAAK